MQVVRDDEVQRVTGSVQALLREATALAGSLAAASGLEPTDARALKALDLLADGPLTAGDLGVALGLSSAAVTGLLDRLEAAGLAVRIAHATDRRRVQAQLTDRAREFGSDLLRPLQRRIGAAIAAASDDELATVARFLVQLTDTTSPTSTDPSAP